MPSKSPKKPFIKKILNESFFGAGFNKFKMLADQGEDPESAAVDAGYTLIGQGFTRKVYEHPSNNNMVLKIAHGEGNFGEGGDLDLAMKTNTEEAAVGRNPEYEIFPKTYPSDPGGSWLLAEKVIPINTAEQFQSLFPETDTASNRWLMVLLFDMGASYAREMQEIHSGISPLVKPDKFEKKIEELKGSSSGQKVVKDFYNLWDNALFRDISKAIATYGIDPMEIRPKNVGFAMRDGSQQFVILDVSVGLGDQAEKSISESLLKEAIKFELTHLNEVSIGRKLDRATNQISRNIVSMLKRNIVREKHALLPVEGQLQFKLQDVHPGEGDEVGIDADLVDIETVGNIIIFLEATDGELWTAGAYQYNHEDRSTSDLIVALGLPRNYEFNIFSLVIPEIKEAIRHELEHGVESTEVLQSMEGIPEDHFESMASMIDYYSSDAETRGYVAGLYKKAKSLRLPAGLVIDHYLADVYHRAMAAEMLQQEAEEGTRQIREKWYDYLVQRWPEAEKYL